MKIAVIGGGGVRTPLLANGLTQSDLPIDEIALFDIDQERLSTIAPVARLFAPSVRTYADMRACVSGAAFVFLSIRAGGIAARARDETIAVEHGIAGQETIGPAGFAMAMRTVPPAVEYAAVVAEESPQAWIVNFTNPVGIVTQAMASGSGARVIGICDTPTELFEEAAHALDVDAARCSFDYFGLNHLGWVREVTCDGRGQIERLWREPERIARVYRAPLFETAFLQSLRLLPSEYLFYYYRPEVALQNIKRAGRTRGGAIAALNDRLFHDLTEPGVDRQRVYEQYLEARSGGYMQIESGSPQPIARSPWSELTGYDKIALSVVRAIHGNTRAVIPLNVQNGTAIRDLGPADVVEVPCVVTSSGARPLPVGEIPDAARDLMLRVKEYERLTIDAASSASRDAAERALASNPLVGDTALARRLVQALLPW